MGARHEQTGRRIDKGLVMTALESHEVLGQSQYYKNRLKYLMAVDRVRVIV